MTPTKRSMELQVRIFKASACFMSRLRANIAFMSRDMWNQFLLHCNLKFNKISLSVACYQRGDSAGSLQMTLSVDTRGRRFVRSPLFLTREGRLPSSNWVSLGWNPVDYYITRKKSSMKSLLQRHLTCLDLTFVCNPIGELNMAVGCQYLTLCQSV